jgi:hypothetical protein
MHTFFKNIALSFSLPLFCNMLSAQTGAIKSGFTTLYVNNHVTPPLVTGASISLEYAISKRFTMSSAFEYLQAEVYINGDNRFSYTAKYYIFRPECRFYFKEALNGAFIGTSIGLSSYKYAYLPYPDKPFLRLENGVQLEGAFMTGVMLKPSKSFCIEICGGLGIASDNYAIVCSSLRLGYVF